MIYEDRNGPLLNGEVRSEFREIGQHEGGVTECVLSRDERRVYTTGVDGFVRVWDLQSGEAEESFHPRIGEIHALALSPDESTIAVGGKPLLLDRSHVVLIDAENRCSDARTCRRTNDDRVDRILARWNLACCRQSLRAGAADANVRRIEFLVSDGWAKSDGLVFVG